MAIEYPNIFTRLCRVLLTVVLCLTLLASSDSNSGFGVTKKIPMSGQGGWDYLTVDDAARRLYVSHGTQVEILNLDSQEWLGSIPTAGVHGVALAPEFGRGFISDGKASTILVFDLKTMKVLQEVGSPKDPDAIIYDPASKRVFAFNGDSNNVTAIDAASGRVVGTVDLGGGPEFAVPDGNGYVFDNLEDLSEVVKIDARKLTIEQRWPTAACASPSSMAMDRPNRRLFIGCRSKVMAVMNADTGQIITTLPIDDHVDATVFDPETRLIFNSNGEGTITVIHQDGPDKYSVVESVKTLPRAKTMALDPKTHQLFLSTAESGQFEVLVVGHTQVPQTETRPVELRLPVNAPFRFVTCGDARFHDPKDMEAANPPVRRALVDAIAQANPAFISFGGDIVYTGDDLDDWKVWDSETSEWHARKIPIFPALGNHDLHGNEKAALANYFERFPDLNNSRYYSVRAANVLMIVLDSSLDEISGPQGQWLTDTLDNVFDDVDFILLVLHHPPYTSSSDAKKFGGGHSARSQEQDLAKTLEARQQNLRARIVVFSGHVHNYERHEHSGVTYFVTGGAGAHAYPIERAPDDPFQSREVNYHYLLVEVDRDRLKVTMHRLDLASGTVVWTQPDAVTLSAPATKAVAHGQSGKAN